MIRKKTLLLSVLIGVLSFILVRIWQQRRSTMLQKLTSESEKLILIDERTTVTHPSSVQSSSKMRRDDLKKIEGIGPKIAGILENSGIFTFEQLSNTSVMVLEQILKNANLRLARPATWPEQASYAAQGNWEGLRIFQEQLKGGVRK